jgi:hypothetical protein
VAAPTISWVPTRKALPSRSSAVGEESEQKIDITTIEAARAGAKADD